MKREGIRFVGEHVGLENGVALIAQDFAVVLILGVKWLGTLRPILGVVFVRPGAIHSRLRTGNVVEQVGGTAWNLENGREDGTHDSGIGTGGIYRRDNI